MGKNCDVSKQRKRLMKTLRNLSEKLECTPQCQVNPFPCNPCHPFGFFPSCGPPKCNCFLVQNHRNKPCCATNSCGPFPDSCSFFFQPSTDFQKCFCACKSSRCRKTQCCTQNCHRRCFCKSFNPVCYACLNRFKSKYPCCECPNISNPKCECCTPSCCTSRLCHPKCIQYTNRCKRSPIGNLCFGCNSICLPKGCSDTCLATEKHGKKLSCSKSVELRGGKLFRGCDCDKKNGLQDRCQRYCCINNPKCKTSPASCHCSKFSCEKHLNILYGKKKTINYTCYMCGPFMYPIMPFCPPTFCRCQCQSQKCENECQCSPPTCEAGCCCELEAPESCQPCLGGSNEPCCASVGCTAQCEPCGLCVGTDSPSLDEFCYPCQECCDCEDGTQTYEHVETCYAPCCISRCRGCQTCY